MKGVKMADAKSRYEIVQELADKIGISKSTVFIGIKKVRKHLQKVIDNPFQ